MRNSKEYDVDLSTSCAAFVPMIMFERLLHHREEIQLLESFAFGLDLPFSAERRRAGFGRWWKKRLGINLRMMKQHGQQVAANYSILNDWSGYLSAEEERERSAKGRWNVLERLHFSRARPESSTTNDFSFFSSESNILQNYFSKQVRYNAHFH